MSTQDRPPRSRSSPLGAPCPRGGARGRALLLRRRRQHRCVHDACRRRLRRPHPGHDATVDRRCRQGSTRGSTPGRHGRGCTLPAPFEDAGSRVSELRTTLDAGLPPSRPRTPATPGCLPPEGERPPGPGPDELRAHDAHARAPHAAANAGAMLERAFHQTRCTRRRLRARRTAPSTTARPTPASTRSTNATELALQALPALLASDSSPLPSWTTSARGSPPRWARSSSTRSR